MVYKKYIKRGGKKFGPYYFKSVRDKNGKVKSIYLGSNYKEKSFFNKNVGKLYIFGISIIFLIFLFYGLNFTGFSVVDVENLTFQNLEEDFDNFELKENESFDYNLTNETKVDLITGEVEIKDEEHAGLIQNISEINETLISRVIVNEPVRFIKNIKLEESTSNLEIILPSYAEVYNIKDAEGNLIGDYFIGNEKEQDVTGAFVVFKNDKFDLIDLFEEFFAVTGLVVYDENEEIIVHINEEVQEVFIEYGLPGPISEEIFIDKYKKKIIVSSDIHYENVLAFTEIDNFPERSIKLYHMDDGIKIDVTEDELYSLNYVDSDGDGLIDRIEWNVPSLSSDEYEVEITILNVQSYPSLHGNWTVMFNTVGMADLVVTAFNGTTWTDDEIAGYDLEFIEIRCGDELVDYTWVNDSVFVSNYSCNETGYEISTPHTIGKHTLRFDFGSQLAYAYNDVTYQENADSTWGDDNWLSGFGFGFDKVVDGNWGTSGFSLTLAYGFMNYTKPAGTENAIWQVKDASATTNLTIIDDCFNQEELQLQIVSYGTNSDTNWTCWDGTSWKVLRSYHGSSIVYEEGVYWNIMISDNAPPEITVDLPEETNYSSLSIDFNITSNEDLAGCNVSIDGFSTNETMLNESDGLVWNFTNESMDIGYYWANFSCEDLSGNVNDTEGVFFEVIDPDCNLVITADKTLTRNISCYADGITFGANDIVLDCDGYMINYSTLGVQAYGVNNTDGYNNITIKNCVLEDGDTGGNLHYGIRFINGGLNSTIDNNTIITYDDNAMGIVIGDDSINNLVVNNTIITYGDNSKCIYLVLSDCSNLNNNTIITSGPSEALFLQGSNYNNITSNTINTTFFESDAIAVKFASDSSSFSHNKVLQSGGNAVGFYVGFGNYPNYNNFSNNSFSNICLDDFNFSSEDINYNYLIDQVITNYSFLGVGSIVYFKNSSSGELLFMEPINGSGENLDKDINITENSFSVNSEGKEGLNRSSNLTFFGLSFTGAVAALRNDVSCGKYCGDLEKDGSNYYFNVSYFTNYSIDGNNLPGAPTLDSPADEDNVEGRKPIFMWINATDIDNDDLTYSIEVDNDADFSSPIINVTNIDDDRYTPSQDLDFDDGNNEVYYWRVIADDGSEQGSYSSTFEFTLISRVEITMPNSTIGFGTMDIGDNNDTTDNSPEPFTIQNDGNCWVDVNISLEGTGIWESVFSPTGYFTYKIDNYTAGTDTEYNAFNDTYSVIGYTPVPQSNTSAIANLSYDNSSDIVEVDINITVPPNEPAGAKSAYLWFWAEIGE